MSFCAIIGDSIALGLALANPSCMHSVKVGRTTQQIAIHAPTVVVNWVIISAGSNKGPNTRNSLVTIRRHITADKVVWILPRHGAARGWIRTLAISYGDNIQEFKAGKDGIHPQNYNYLNRLIHTKFKLGRYSTNK
jgi:hypothetical protein